MDQDLDLRPGGADSLPPAEWDDEQGVQPAWILERYPDQRADQHGMVHELTSVRRAEHRGHEIVVTTSYRIEVDGREVHLHVGVGDDGRLRCHSTPYRTFASALDLMRTLIDRFPESFPPGPTVTPTGTPSPPHGHAGHAGHAGATHAEAADHPTAEGHATHGGEGQRLAGGRS